MLTLFVVEGALPAGDDHAGAAGQGLRRIFTSLPASEIPLAADNGGVTA
ncbi:hypothetical protein [Streptomyces sp. NPDC127197]